MDSYEQLISLGLLESKAPRYTSYPTTPHFSASVDGASMADWLGRVPAGEAVSLYLHIPFCERLCWFCACRTQGLTAREPLEAYLDTLLREVDLVAGHLRPGVEVAHLHLGGGTPTILSARQLSRLLIRLRGAFSFRPDAEVAAEIDPTCVDEAKIAALADEGLTRASVGIQDFDPMVQDAIGRRQSLEQTRAVRDALRAAGIARLNTDIVYGLPHQDWPRLSRTLDAVIDLAPDRIALFGYAHVPWVAKRQRVIDATALPAPHHRLEATLKAGARLERAGYAAIGIDHFARPDDALAQAAQADGLHRNFQGYTDDRAQTLIALGASGISRFAQGYAQNAPATAAYQGRIRSGDLATVRGHRLSLEDRLRAAAIEALLCRFSLDLADLADHFGDFADVLRADCARIAERFGKAVEWTGARLTIMDHPRALARMVAMEFDAYSRPDARHSAAV
ncbi:MAG: oxygen-independent coproporphyrinogen III oxidase [Pseudomonadota bacterium]